MSKHNYSQYSKKDNDAAKTAVEPEVIATVEVETEPESVVTPAIVDQTPEIDSAAVTERVETVTGTVANCAKLNVRAKPIASAEVVCVLDAASEIEVNVAKSTKNWVGVCTATGIEGYCMRQFVDVSL